MCAEKDLPPFLRLSLGRAASKLNLARHQKRIFRGALKKFGKMGRET